MIDYAFLPAAEAEVADAILYYEAQVGGLGSSFLEAIERTVTFIRQYPAIGTRSVGTTRRVLVAGYPYAVVFRQRTESVLVIAVAHVRRQPGYWSTRSRQV